MAAVKKSVRKKKQIKKQIKKKSQSKKQQPKKLQLKHKPGVVTLNRRHLIRTRFQNKMSEVLFDLKTSQKESLDEVEWVAGNRYINGKPWSYESAGPKIEYGEHDIQSPKLMRPYLFQLLRDKSPTRSVIKSRQTEMTENHINEALFYCCTRPHTGISHVFPTDDMGDNISTEKIGVAILESPLIKKKLLGQGAVRRYMFRNASIYGITGALKKTGGRASSRDIVIFDETDLIPESVFGVYSALMEHSALRLVRNVSTPTVPMVGIDKLIRASCDFSWLWNCQKCKKEQDFVFPDNLINFFEITDYEPDHPDYQKKLDKAYIGCRHCGSYLDRNAEWYLKNSRWVAAVESLIGINAGYRMNAFMIPWKTGKELLRRYHELSNYISQYFNENIGIAYLKGENRVSDADIMDCQCDWRLVNQRTANMSRVSAGIDWGEKRSYIVISARGFDNQDSQKRCIVYMEEINEQTVRNHNLVGHPTAHAEIVCRILERFRPDIIVNDANGIGAALHKHILKRFPKRNYGAWFDTAEASRQLRQSRLLVPTWNDSGYKVTFSKIGAIKEVQNDFRLQNIGMPLLHGDEAETIRAFIKHNVNMAIQPRWDTLTEREYEVYVKLGDDHFGDANIYSHLGDTKLSGFTQRTPGVVLKKR